MEWSKLKNIILLLLVSVNAFLLILVGVQESRAARYEEDTRQAAVRVLEQSGITFGPERVPQEAGLSPLTVTRDRESEAIVAQTLLGVSPARGKTMSGIGIPVYRAPLNLHERHLLSAFSTWCLGQGT